MSFYTALTGPCRRADRTRNGRQQHRQCLDQRLQEAARRVRRHHHRLAAAGPQGRHRGAPDRAAVPAGRHRHLDNALDLAISGQGFFAVKAARQQPGGLYLQRRIQRDRRPLCRRWRRRLQLFPTTADGSILTNALGSTTNLQLPLSSGLPSATANIAMTVNLPATAFTVISAPFDPADKTTYTNATSTTIYDSLGNPMAATAAKTALPTMLDPVHH